MAALQAQGMGSRQSIGGIRPFAELTRGPMTVVYKGYDPSADRFVLLKVLRPEYLRDRAVREAFTNETRLLARVQHPNVVAVIDSGIDGDTGFLVTEFVEGMSLREMLERGEIPPSIAAYVAAQTADGLQAAHRAGVLHRDLKPDNILLSTGGEVKITDFGMAVTAESAGEQKPLIAGTLGFVAPEVIQGETPTEASDVFSLGATLYQMLTGITAFAGSTDGEIIDATVNRNPMHRVNEFSTAPPGLLVICGRLLQKRPEDRLASSAEVMNALHGWLAEYGGSISATDLAQFVNEPANAAPLALTNDRFDQGALSAKVGSTLPASRPTPLAANQKAPPFARWRGWKSITAAAGAAAVLLALSIFALTDRSATGDGSSAEDSVFAATPGLSVPADSSVVESRAVGQTRSTSGDSSRAVEDENPLADAIRIAAIENGPEVRQLPESTELSARPMTTTSIREAANGGLEPPEVSSGLDADNNAALKPAIGTITVRTVPWASLWVDGNSLGGNFADTLTLEAGTHQIVLRNPDFPELVEEIDVVADDHRDYDLSLWARVARLSLVVVPWAVVEIDGTVRDTIPPQDKPFILSPGAHRLRLLHPELGEITRDVLLTAGEHRSLSYNMRRASAE